ncbi:SusC/RagA family TonB-linked outer membrane protein [Sunxiuqinia sp. sy24]|uniref:SusC/RagA family TonB-linked outer membrane protein n=1 Tax=Sunxiuqinia sp. sy24 TaxID=3461495 RepID=UPI0040464FFC
MKKIPCWSGGGMPALKKLRLIMKLNLFLLLISVFPVAAGVNAQNAKLNLKMTKATIAEVFDAIEQKSDVYFFYNKQEIDDTQLVDVAFENKTIEEVLDYFEKNLFISSQFVGKNVIIKSQTSEFSVQQKRRIIGKVTDASGQPLPGVTVLIKGTTDGTITDFDGNYAIADVPGNGILVFSFVGMQAQQIVVGNQGTINVVLEEDAIGIEEVVALGFATEKKSNVTGATTTVDMENVLGNRPVTNAIQAIQGTVPGMQVTVPSGEPGATTSINLRGIASINGGSALILMDNVPVQAEDINPQDIESITVLKDAAASSIYGARAAFGVVLITTKKAGKDQPVKFNYSNTFSFGMATDISEKESTYNFVNALNDWNQSTHYSGKDIQKWVGYVEAYKENPDLYPEGLVVDAEDGLTYELADTDVIDALLNDKAFSQIHNFNFSGGGEKTQYRVSLGYSDEDGVMVSKNDRYTKYNLNTYLSTALTDKLNASFSVNYRNSERLTPRVDYYWAVTALPYDVEDGYRTFEDDIEMPYDTPANRASLQKPNEESQGNLRLLGKLEYELIKDLFVTGEYTYESKNRNNYSIDEQMTFALVGDNAFRPGNPDDTYYQKENTQKVYKAANFYVNYKKQLGGHSIKALAGINKEEYHQEYFYARKTNLLSPELPSLSTATGIITADDSFGEWAVLGYFGRINYNYKEKYFVEANGRYDGSSKFAAREKYGFFPSFSLGWNIAREGFMSDIEALSHLKLRASWGEIGNQNVGGDYLSIPGMTITNASWINPDSGLRYNTINSPSLVSQGFTWETVQTLNFGVDVKVLNNRLSTSFDVYKRKTLGMITAAVKVPDVLGTIAPPANAADLESHGWELEMSWKDKIQNFNYNIGFTLFDNQSEITHFNNPAGLINTYYEGQILGDIWGYVTERYYTVDDFVEGTLDENLTGGTLKEGIEAFIGRNPNPGDIKYKNLNGDEEISPGSSTLSDAGDRKIIGNNKRRYQYGIFGNASYENFDFSFVLNGVGKRDLYINNNIRFPYIGQFATMHAGQMDYWTSENTDAYFPRNYEDGGENYGNNRLTQTKYLIDGTYLRIKNITFGYTLPKLLLSKINIEKFRVYVSGENLHSFDDMPDGIDTELEAKNQGIYYPLIKSFNVGVNVTF